MARPKSEEKRSRLLSVATEVFAKNGLSASTASITKEKHQYKKYYRHLRTRADALYHGNFKGAGPPRRQDQI